MINSKIFCKSGPGLDNEPKRCLQNDRDKTLDNKTKILVSTPVRSPDFNISVTDCDENDGGREVMMWAVRSPSS